MNVNVHIERLIVDGVNVPPGQSHLLQASVQVELARLLTDRGVSPRLKAGGALPQVVANGIQLASGNDVAHLGAQIARTVYGGIRK